MKDTYLFWADLGNNAKVLDSCLKTLLCDSDTWDTMAVPPEIYERADRIAAIGAPGQRRRALPALVQRQHLARAGRVPARRLPEHLAQHQPRASRPAPSLKGFR